MKLEFDGLDLTTIDGVEIVDVTWPASVPRTIAELALPAGDGSTFVSSSLEPMEVSVKFRLYAPDRDIDSILGRWTIFAAELTTRGLADLKVKRLTAVENSITEEQPAQYVTLTYQAIASAFSAVDMKATFGEATVTFRIPFPIGNAGTEEGGIMNGTNYAQWSYRPHPILYEGRGLNAASLGNTYPPLVYFTGGTKIAAASKSAVQSAQDLSLVIKRRYTNDPNGTFKETLFTLPVPYELIDVDHSILFKINNDERTAEVYCLQSSSWVSLLPTLDSVWFDPVEGNYLNQVTYWLECNSTQVQDYTGATFAVHATRRWI